MATVWGGWDGNARIGLNIHRSSQTASAETWICEVWLGRKYAATFDRTGNAKWTVTGSFKGSGTAVVASGGSLTIKLGSFTKSFTRPYGRTSKGAVSVTITKFSNYNPPSVTATFIVSARPYSAPAAPTSVSARRSTDSQFLVSFTTSTTTAAPVNSVTIQRAINGGSYSTVATITGTGTKTWSDTGTFLGNYHTYRVRSNGGGGSSSWVYTPDVYAKPFAPSGVTAVKDDQQNIVIGWVNNAKGLYSTLVEDVNTGTTWPVGRGTISFTIPDPDPSIPHQYAVYHTVAGLESEHTLSPQVQLLTNPLAPSALSPDGAYVLISTPITVSWRYNSADTTAQTKFEVATSTDGEEWVSAGEYSSSESSTVLTSGYTDPTSIYWKVRTWGQDPNKPSPWSAVARINVIPVSTIVFTEPASGETIASANAAIAFTSTDATSWEAVLATGEQIVQTMSGQFVSGKASWLVSGLKNNTSYTVTVTPYTQVASPPVSRSFKIVYPAPPVPNVKAGEIDENGSVLLEIDSPPASGDRRVVRVVVERVEDDGGTFTVADVQADQLPLSQIDRTVELTKSTTYRVTSYTALNETASTTLTVTPTVKIDKIFLTSADGYIFAEAIWDPEHSRQVGLAEQTEHYMLGREQPVLFSGVQRDRKFTVSATILPHEFPTASRSWEAVAFYGKPLMYRDPSGSHVWVSVTGVKLVYDRPTKTWRVSFNAREVAYG